MRGKGGAADGGETGFEGPQLRARSTKHLLLLGFRRSLRTFGAAVVVAGDYKLLDAKVWWRGENEKSAWAQERKKAVHLRSE